MSSNSWELLKLILELITKNKEADVEIQREPTGG
jgi:hypothetical protein